MNKKSIIKLLTVVIILNISFLFLSACIDTEANLKEGIYAEYVVVDTDAEVDEIVKNLKDFLVSRGFKKFSVKRQDEFGIRIELPETDRAIDILDNICDAAWLSMRLDNGEVIITGDDIAGAYAGCSNNVWTVMLKLTEEGDVKFADATGRHMGETLNTYVIYGENYEMLVSAATINEAITNGVCYISGYFDQQRAEDLADMIMLGKIGARLELQIMDKIV